VKGTWQTDNSGGGVMAAIIIALVLIGSGIAAAIAQALVWIIAMVAACAVLSVAGMVWLMRWHRRQAAEVGAELAARRQAATPAAKTARQITPPQQPTAIEQHIHYHWHAAPDSPARITIPRRLEADR